VPRVTGLYARAVATFAVWAFGADRPGIVAALTGALLEEGCNLSDCSMTILSGHFAMVLVVDAPGGVDAAGLEAALRAPTASFELGTAVRAIGPDELRPPEGAPHVVTVFGADRPGIVHRVASLLADVGVNITDLETRTIGDQAHPVYAMLLEVTIPAGVVAEELEAALRSLADTLDVDARIHPADVAVL